MEQTTKKKDKEKQSTSLKQHIENVKAEFNRITWLDKESLTKKTIAVVASTVGLGAIIGLVDMIVKYGLGLIIS
jgi:preprotein translocase subunit SecE